MLNIRQCHQVNIRQCHQLYIMTPPLPPRRDQLAKEEGLRPRTDASFLLPFLRARKFDYDRALTMVGDG